MVVLLYIQDILCGWFLGTLLFVLLSGMSIFIKYRIFVPQFHIANNEKIFVPVKDLIDCNLRCYQVIKQKLKLLLKMYSTKDLNILLNKYS